METRKHCESDMSTRVTTIYDPEISINCIVSINIFSILGQIITVG